MFGRVYRVRRDRHLLGYDGNHGLARLLQDRPRNQVVYAIACVVVHQRAHQLVARHSPVPVGEMLFAIGFSRDNSVVHQRQPKY